MGNSAVNFVMISGAVVLLGMMPIRPAPAQVLDTAPARRTNVTPDRDQVERRLQSVKTLIESSSAARQIEASGNAEAQAQRNKARQLRRHSEEAFDAGDMRSATGLLDDAARQIFEGVRMLAGQQDKNENRAVALATRLESARALLAAHKRISAEKAASGSAETAARIEQLLNAAGSHLASKRYEDAGPLVDQAYLMAKASIDAMRGGDTLVRSLKFASKEEEFHYEVDRNDTHQMLLRVLIQKKPDSPTGGSAGEIQAAKLRQDADAAGRRGDYIEGIRLLEEATRELVRAIRSAGVYIPG